MTLPVCLICGQPGRACGDDHIIAPVINSELIKGAPAVTSPDQPVPLAEYEYYVGHMPITAQLTEAQAERMGAKPVGQAVAPKEGEVPNNEAQRAASHMAEPDAQGAEGDDPDALNKARETRNRRAR